MRAATAMRNDSSEAFIGGGSDGMILVEAEAWNLLPQRFDKIVFPMVGVVVEEEGEFKVHLQQLGARDLSPYWLAVVKHLSRIARLINQIVHVIIRKNMRLVIYQEPFNSPVHGRIGIVRSDYQSSLFHPVCDVCRRR